MTDNSLALVILLIAATPCAQPRGRKDLELARKHGVGRAPSALPDVRRAPRKCADLHARGDQDGLARSADDGTGRELQGDGRCASGVPDLLKDALASRQVVVPRVGQYREAYFQICKNVFQKSDVISNRTFI